MQARKCVPTNHLSSKQNSTNEKRKDDNINFTFFGNAS